MNAVSMVNTCYRRQNPEAFGGEVVNEPSIPAGIRYRTEWMHQTADYLAEEPMGNGEVMA